MTGLSWDYYRSFLAVLQAGTLSGAAKALGIAQPTVGRHMDALEAALGFALFTRSRNGFRPTEAALSLRPQAEAMAATARALARDAAAAAEGGLAGTVRVSASDVVGVEVLPPVFAALSGAHPRLAIELVLSDAVTDLLSRAADIAVRMTPPVQGALLAKRIGDIPLGMFAHKAYLKRHGTPRAPEDLGAHRLIGFDQETAFIRAMRKRHPEFAALRFAFRAESNLAQLAAIRAGAGIGMCQCALAARDKALVRLFPNRFAMVLPCYVVMHRDLRTVPRHKLVFDALVVGLKRYVGLGAPP